MSDSTTAVDHGLQHAPHLLHHFDDADQQKSASTLGMWLFLAQEVMFFGGMFAVYTVYRILNPAAFAHASHHLDIVPGLANTAVLITSSLTMAMAVHAAQTNRQKPLVRWLGLTLVLGLVFVCIKSYEYWHKWHDGLVPGPWFRYDALEKPAAELFFSIYFMMTGVHALHMLIGFGMLAWLIRKARVGTFNEDYFTPVELGGLYWHFVDIVWIFLFPLLYLIGRH